MKYTENNRDAVIAGYLEALLWSSGGHPDYSEAPDGYVVQRYGNHETWEYFKESETVTCGGYTSRQAACEAAWVDCGEEPPALYGLEDFEVSEELLKASRDDVDAFLETNTDDILEYVEKRQIDPTQGSAWHYLGHDFALTRNRHGVGFWDRGLGELGDRLTEATHVYGSVDVYLGDDDQVYV